MSNRIVDPTNTVRTQLDREKGIRTQADTDRESRRAARFPGEEDSQKRILSNPTITGHLKHKGSAPSIAVGAALGTGGSVGAVISGTDQAGELTLTAGTTTLTTGLAATITFNTARLDANYTISLTPGGTPTWAVQWRVNNPNTTTWTISFGVAPASGAVFKFYYSIMEWTS